MWCFANFINCLLFIRMEVELYRKIYQKTLKIECNWIVVVYFRIRTSLIIGGRRERLIQVRRGTSGRKTHRKAVLMPLLKMLSSFRTFTACRPAASFLVAEAIDTYAGKLHPAVAISLQRSAASIGKLISYNTFTLTCRHLGNIRMQVNLRQ